MEENNDTSYSLADMSFLEDVTLIVNSLQGLQQLHSPNSSFEEIPNSLMSKEACFAKALKLASKQDNMLHKGEDSNTEEDNESIQTTRKLDRGSAKKVNS